MDLFKKLPKIEPAEDIIKSTVDEKTKKKEMAIYRSRLMRGESEKSAKSGLKIFESNYEISRIPPIPPIKNKTKIKSKTYIEESVQSSDLIRPTDMICPNCPSELYNTKLDGVHYYCPKCKRQWDIYG